MNSVKKLLVFLVFLYWQVAEGGYWDLKWTQRIVSSQNGFRRQTERLWLLDTLDQRFLVNGQWKSGHVSNQGIYKTPTLKMLMRSTLRKYTTFAIQYSPYKFPTCTSLTNICLLVKRPLIWVYGENALSPKCWSTFWNSLCAQNKPTTGIEWYFHKSESMKNCLVHEQFLLHLASVQ